MEDWDAAQERRPKPDFLNDHQIGFIVAVGVVLFAAISVGYRVAVRHENPTPAERDAEVRQAASLLLGADGTARADDTLTADGPGALDLLLGQSLVLHGRKVLVRVTPEHVGKGDCADGPAVTVDLVVEQLQGRAELTPTDFSMLTSDGEDVLPIPACSTGFDDKAAKRTLVFGATGPGQLLYGTAPVAMWRLT
ncbi:hypothetical protein HH310_14920 [Actinoplanes sp. TBRC 11911]|uniref:hypothetical protein n=1 Tax=Actinoplanes sp. TBRC 11911 TaxID=2729386 RepID=UPI00145E2EA5|nr:hypothetical protein [Actinoplanes sp. TBRC 11911]NMO52480.1 hypothetical protein [Actinoplanes sp. TBRC 11911]